MGKITLIFLGGLIGLFSCRQEGTTGQTSVSETADTVITFDSLTTFEYVYPHNTEDLIEDHYILLRSRGDSTIGLYYGTSDEFDQGREGYLPGFFVADMQDIRIDDDSIHFIVRATDDDMFTRAVDLNIETTDKARVLGYEKWDIGLRTNEKMYHGAFLGDTILIKDGIDDRFYVRR
ncbi:MAG: hypothetical protein WEB30_12705 [Cyclobacteriaceae bacterium]